MLTHTSVYTACAPSTASRGSACSVSEPVRAGGQREILLQRIARGRGHRDVASPRASQAPRATARRCCRRRHTRCAAPSSEPYASRSVSRSASAWQGWWQAVSMLITGTVLCCGELLERRVWLRCARRRRRHAGRARARCRAATLRGRAAARRRAARRDGRPARGCRPRTTAGCGSRASRRSTRRSSRRARVRRAAPAFSSSARSSSAVSSAGVSSAPVRKWRVMDRPV